MGYVSTGTGTVAFNLDGKRKEIKGILGIVDGSGLKGATIQFYGDGSMIKEYTTNAGDLPKDFDINAAGVVKLEIKIIVGKNTYGNISLANVMIK